MQAENIQKNVDEININDFVTKNDKDVLELKKHVLSSGSVVPLLHFKKLNELSMIDIALQHVLVASVKGCLKRKQI